MNIQVPGCSGGLAGDNKGGSTCIQINHNILIDAGTGLNQLSLAQMHQVRHVFLTHSHMDHIAALPTFLSNQYGSEHLPVTVYAQAHTLEKLENNIFNGDIWPELGSMTEGPDAIVRFEEIQPDQSITIESNWTKNAAAQSSEITAFAVEHSVPTVGYSVKSQGRHFVFAADTIAGKQLTKQLNRLGHIDTLMLECAFPDELLHVAEKTKHMTPGLLQSALSSLKQQPAELWVTHLKPSYESALRKTLQANPPHKNTVVL
ncbi:ribonuclease BN (tRNA processing enzyme) [Idiomarina loihiensis]|uniref:3',5'-cyclic-nucleotide phosphodiesterase n=1 Tax=Idiomarina TaxID=135575 RepID=UPI000D71B09F|nr:MULTISPECIES: 3',5'-cyclic-nucleotide phosphodiesterase [Idiomarina]PWW36927.1 ribonuclease BN (tRNA processing enzyme) [Idiomarina loihiensis]TDP46735.1 ribonuclease BN (tRNA processing enzyme) [Idiomarina loihiensis]TDS23006.1 ribonuclease BN (tRNA processing enzyme) [Idiomarina sp. H2]